LENWTNTPLQDIRTWVVDIRTDTWAVDMYITNTIKKTWKINELFWTMEFLANSQKYDKPQKDCLKWFIPVPWNMDLWQPAFCVAKYEMSYADSYWDTPNTLINYWTYWNTVAYTWSKIPGSMAWKYPIVDITQQQAIDSCKSIWQWYHLITNNEWMTIARNIEKQPINWSWWVVWVNYVFNWVSNDLNKWCNIDLTWITWRRWATKTWDKNCTWQRNKLTLSNWQQIWDLAWNVFEHINKANTLDWSNYGSWTSIISWMSSLGIDDDWIYSKIDMNKYWSIYWYWISKWMWNVLNLNLPNNILLRSGRADLTTATGIFTLHYSWDFTRSDETTGFRCAY